MLRNGFLTHAAVGRMLVGMAVLTGVVALPRPCAGQAVESDGPASVEIRRLAEEDQADRKGPWPLPAAEERRLTARDRERRRRIADLLRQDRVVTGEDFDHAALLFQHGARPSDYLEARELAILAGMKGRYGSLPALAEDRYLVSIHRPQRFGSQSRFDAHGKQHLQPVDEAPGTGVTDALRLDLLVPPLALSKTRFEKAAQEAGPVILARLEKRLDPARRAELESSDASRELAQLYQASQRSASAASAASGRVLRLYRDDRLRAPRDYFHAAAVLFRSAGAGGKDAAARLLLANELAAVAAIRGSEGAPRLFAETWDRYARATRLKPRYGTLPGSKVDAGVPLAVRRVMLSAPPSNPPAHGSSRKGPPHRQASIPLPAGNQRTRVRGHALDHPGVVEAAAHGSLAARAQQDVRRRCGAAVSSPAPLSRDTAC